VVAGSVDESDVEGAIAAVDEILHSAGIAGGARVRVTGLRENAVVQINLRVCGGSARVQIAGPTAAMAIASAGARLRDQIRRMTTGVERWPWPDPDKGPLGGPGDGRIARVKEWPLYAGKPCHAVAFMNAMDYDVMLYVDAESGEDAIVYRTGPTGLGLARQHSMHPATMPASLPLTVNPRKVPDLTVAEACGRVGEGWLPYLFFTNPDTRRGNLLYRRYDGALGLITPMDGAA
jgi:hypothetical protein